MKRRKKIRVKSHFREGRRANHNHPAYIVGAKNGNFRFLTITHSASDKGRLNKKLRKNPNPNPRPEDKGKTSYLIPRLRNAKKEKFGNKLAGWGFTRKDKKKIKMAIQAKRKHARKKPPIKKGR